MTCTRGQKAVPGYVFILPGRVEVKERGVQSVRIVRLVLLCAGLVAAVVSYARTFGIVERERIRVNRRQYFVQERKKR